MKKSKLIFYFLCIAHVFVLGLFISRSIKYLLLYGYSSPERYFSLPIGGFSKAQSFGAILFLLCNVVITILFLIYPKKVFFKLFISASIPILFGYFYLVVGGLLNQLAPDIYGVLIILSIFGVIGTALISKRISTNVFPLLAKDFVYVFVGMLLTIFFYLLIQNRL